MDLKIDESIDKFNRICPQGKHNVYLRLNKNIMKEAFINKSTIELRDLIWSSVNGYPCE